jgi:hypothetical protein
MSNNFSKTKIDLIQKEISPASEHMTEGLAILAGQKSFDCGDNSDNGHRALRPGDNLR